MTGDVLKTRIIPVLLHRGKTLYKGTKFNSWRSVGSALQAARIHEQRNVDELIVLQIGKEPRENFDLLREITAECYMPVTVGGDIVTMGQVHDAFEAGADKVCLSRAAVINRPFIDRIAQRYGSQAVVVSVDVEDDDHIRGSDQHVDNFVHAVVQSGAGELLVQRMSRDGTMNGYDCDLVRRVASLVSVPVIASCGAGMPEHCAEVLRAGAHAVAAGALFQFTEETPKSVAQYLHDQGFKVRL
jgi:cyclase